MADNKSPSEEQIPEEMKKKFNEIKSKLDKFKKKILEKFDKYIVSIALLPPEKEEDKKNINVLVLVDDSDSQKMSKEELTDKLTAIIEKTAEEIDKNLKPRTMILSELREACFDGKYEILQLIAMSSPVYDPKDLLAALRICEIHKSMVLKKFEKYIVSYVAVGSLFRGDATSNDIDVAVVVDDTDVKRMSRAELKDKLRAIIVSLGFEAQSITGVKKSLHVQTYILTDFWDSVKDASPVIFTFLRDGVPLYDRGVFMPWKLLLSMGRIKPSPEAIDMHMEIGEKLLERVKEKLLSIVSEDIYYATLNPSQAALMLYGISPPTPKETIHLLNEIFVKKEKLLEKKYVDILEEIRDYYKDVEHGKIKEVAGKDVDSLVKKADDYLKRIKKLFTQIEKRAEGKTILDFYDSCIAVTKDVLRAEEIENIPDTKIIPLFKEKLVKPNKIPERFLGILKIVIKAKEDYEEKKLTKQEIEKVRKDASVFIKTLVEYIQRKRGMELERAKIRIKCGDKFSEVFLLDDIAFIVNDIDSEKKEIRKAKLLQDGSLEDIQESNLEELEKNISKAKIPKKVFIKEKLFENLKELYGKDVEILVNY